MNEQFHVYLIIVLDFFLLLLFVAVQNDFERYKEILMKKKCT